MILYHGTNKAFDTIDLTKSKPNKDFGQGFYLSREYSQAMEMAKTKFDQIKTGFPTVLTYEVDEQQMNQLKVLRFDAYTFEWAQFILMNRRNDTNKPCTITILFTGRLRTIKSVYNYGSLKTR